MSVTIELIDKLKESLGVSSDYAVAKALGITTQRMSNYRTGRNNFDNLMVFKVCDILQIDPGETLVRINAERSKRPAEKQAWEEILKKITSTAAALVLVLQGLLGSPVDAIASQDQNVNRPNDVYYVKLRRRWWRWIIEAWLGLVAFA